MATLRARLSRPGVLSSNPPLRSTKEESKAAKDLFITYAYNRLTTMTQVSAETARSQHLDAHTSDPKTMGWMVGSPPPPTSRSASPTAASRTSRARAGRTRTCGSSCRRASSRAADAPVVRAAARRADDLDEVAFTPLGRTESMTWAESLLANYTDAIVILHRGRIVYERYFGVMDAHTPHIAFSVTKSFVATIARRSCTRACSTSRPRSRLPPRARRRAATRDATIRHLLDMTTGHALHRGLRGRELVDVAVQPRRRLSPAAGGLRGARVVLRLHRDAAEGIARTASDSPTRRSTPIRSDGSCAA